MTRENGADNSGIVALSGTDFRRCQAEKQRGWFRVWACLLKKAVCWGTASGRLRAVPESTHVPECVMLGPAKPRRLDEPIAVSGEDLGPYDHVSFTMQVDAATLLERLLNGEAQPRRRLDPKNWRHPPQSA